jgi:hypothetical protein
LSATIDPAGLNMPVVVEVDALHKIARRTYSGVVTSDDLLGSIHQYALIAGFDTSFDEIMDFREVTNIDVLIEDIHKCAITPVPFTAHTKRIILAPQQAIYGLARMYQIVGEEVHPNVYVVKTMDEANRILAR